MDLDADGLDDVTLWVTPSNGRSVFHAALGEFVMSEAVVDDLIFASPVLALVDLDGDGLNEVFLPGPGNTARNAIVLRTDGCMITPVQVSEPGAPAAGPNAPLYNLLIGAGGNICAPTGCNVKNTCIDSEGETRLEHSLSEPVIEEGSDRFSMDPEATPIRVTTTILRFGKGQFTVIDHYEQIYTTAAELPTDAPSNDTNDRIDC